LSILVIYFIGILLFKEKKSAIFSSLLMAIMPLAVFFSRNLQPESPAFFFMLLGNFLFLKYIFSLDKKYLFLGGIAFSLSWLYKFSFLLGIFPFIFCFPFKNILKQRKELLKTASVLFFSFLIIPLTILWLKHIGQWEFQELNRVRLFEIFTLDYWIKNGRMIRWYLIDENFGLIFTLLAILGILFAFNKKQKSILEYYIIGWTATIILYSMVFSDYINQHNYYQMPFLGLVCIAVTYAIENISKIIRNLLKKDLFVYISCAILILASPFIYDSLKRMFGTVFIGQDVAGESLKEFTQPQERVFIYTHPQGYAIARYAQRYVGWIDDLEEFKKNEDKWNIRYICFYPAEFIHLLAQKNPILFEYIKDNYHFKEAGITQQPQQVYYLILEKGKISNSEDFLKNLSGKIQLRSIYKLFGRYIFFYSLRP
jgi:4-amino-4-deoxy-L-arabinose transferase-like glycosyltransferase